MNAKDIQYNFVALFCPPNPTYGIISILQLRKWFSEEISWYISLSLYVMIAPHSCLENPPGLPLPITL